MVPTLLVLYNMMILYEESWRTMSYDLSCRQVQQELAKPGQLEKFLGDKPQVKITFGITWNHNWRKAQIKDEIDTTL